MSFVEHLDKFVNAVSPNFGRQEIQENVKVRTCVVYKILILAHAMYRDF